MVVERRTGVLIFLFWSILLVIITAISGYNGLYSQDSHEYLRYCNRLTDYFRQGIAPGDYFWPVNYPLMGAVLSFATGSAIALQLISILSASWIIYLVSMFLFREFPGREKEVICYVFIFLGLSPYFFRYSVSTMSDIPALAFTCSAYYFMYLSYKRAGSVPPWLVWFFAAMAVFTRFALLPLVAPAVLLSGFLFLKKFRLLPFLLSMVVAIVPLVVYWYFKQENAGNIFHHHLVSDWSFYNYFKNKFTTADGYSGYIVPNILFAVSFLVHPGFLFPGGLFLVMIFVKKNQPTLFFPLVTAGILLYVGFIAGIPSRNTRYLVPVLPFYVAACFPSFLSVLAWIYPLKKLQPVLFIFVVVIQLALTWRAFAPFYSLNRREQKIAERIIELHPSVLYTFGIDGALRSYGYQGTVINLWDKPLDSVKQGAMLLFNAKENEVQWKGRNPMLNYYFITAASKAVKKETLDSGWEIYEINEAYPPVNTGVPGVR